MKDLTVLFDMDGVLVNTMGGFETRWRQVFPEIKPVPYEKITTFYLENLYPAEHQERVARIWRSRGFFYGLKPIQGSIEAIEEIRKIVKDVAICTAPFTESRYSAQEKWEWVRDNLGTEWLKRLIITKDKTRVDGDILIDDKPKISGVRTPSWEHVIYSQPWNGDINHARRLTWENWREVLVELR
jgi:5'-nucleotidase